MKTLVKHLAFGLTLCASTAVMAQQPAQPVTQAQQDGSANLVLKCALQSAPANWETIRVIFDRTKPQFVLYNIASVKGKQDVVNIDVSKCDYVSQARNLLMFQAIIPADQAQWKLLILDTAPDGRYAVFTDIAAAKAAQQKK